MDVQRRIEGKDRFIWIFAPFVFSLLPFSNALRQGAAAGAGADVVNTLWAMWWFQQELPFVAWGGSSTLFNMPDDVHVSSISSFPTISPLASLLSI